LCQEKLGNCRAVEKKEFSKRGTGSTGKTGTVPPSKRARVSKSGQEVCKKPGMSGNTRSFPSEKASVFGGGCPQKRREKEVVENPARNFCDWERFQGIREKGARRGWLTGHFHKEKKNGKRVERKKRRVCERGGEKKSICVQPKRVERR